MYEFTQDELDRLYANIGNFNHNPVNLAADYVMHSISPRKIDYFPANQLLQVVTLLDKYFQTNLHYHNQVVSVAGQLAENWRAVLAICNGTQDINLLNQEHIEALGEFATQGLTIVFDTPNANDNYSFASKFFHWCTQRHFPIMDQYSRIAIREFQISKGCHQEDIVAQELPHDRAAKLEDYSKWIKFYGKLLRENLRRLEELRTHDTRTQADCLIALCVENSPLRIFDKYFYIKGKELNANNR